MWGRFDLLLKWPFLVAGLAGVLFLPVAMDVLAGERQASPADNVAFDRLIEVIARNCSGCHFKGTAAPAGELALDDLISSHQRALHGESEWRKVYTRVVVTRSMPPATTTPEMSEADRAVIRDWIGVYIPSVPQQPKPSLRRLTNYEYNRSIRDIFGFDFDVESYILKDNAAGGFTNNSSVAFITTDRVHQYFAASNFVSQTALGLNDFLTLKSRHWDAAEILRLNPNRGWRTSLGRFIGDMLTRVKDGQRAEIPPELNIREVNDKTGQETPSLDLERKSRFTLRHDFPITATYVLTIHASGKESRRPAAMDIAIDGVPGPLSIDLSPFSEGLRPHTMEVRVPRGTRSLAFSVSSKYNALLSSVDVIGPIVPDAKPSKLQCVRLAASSANQTDCAAEIVRSVASKAFRTASVSHDEEFALLSPFRAATSSGADFRTALSRSIQGILMDPRFLYRIELERAGGLDDYEFATRLSYFLWGSLPDEELRQLAARRALVNSPATIRAEVGRMIGDSRADSLVDAFANGWLGFGALRNHAVDAGTFPEFDERLRQDMLTETRLYLETFFKENWPIRDLMDSNSVFLNATLARHYGIDGVQGSEFRRIRSAGVRRGLLNQGTVLTLTSHSNGTSVVKRGLWVLEKILCESVGEVPPNIPALEESADRGLTLRQQMEKHRRNPNCASCHDQIDPLGFSLENYDGVGRWRIADAAGPIDPRGSIPSAGGAIPFDNFEGLRQALGNDSRFPACAARNLMTYALGRNLSAGDEIAVRNVLEKTKANGHRIQDVIAEIALSDPFRGASK